MGGIETGWALQVILWFESWRTPLITAIALAFHYAGSEEFYLVLIPFIYWCVDEAFGRRLFLFFVLTSWTNGWFKEWFKRPRPYQVSGRVHNIITETSTYGLPSGHTQNATTLWGVVALKVRRVWVTILVMLYVLLTAISRMVLGVHFPQDVIGGIVIGLALLALYAWLEPKIRAWLNHRGLWMQISVVVAVTAVMLIIYPGLIRPATADALSNAVTPAAVFLGSGIGVALETHSVHFSASGAWWKRIVRLLLGITVVLALYLGLKVLFDGFEPEIVFRLLRYGLIGLWVSVGAPWVFIKLSLADNTTSTD